MKKILVGILALACLCATGCTEEVEKSTVDYSKYETEDVITDSIDYTYYNLINAEFAISGQNDTTDYNYDANVRSLTSTNEYSVINYISQSVGEFVAYNYVMFDGDNSALESGHIAYTDDSDMPENAVLSVTLNVGEDQYGFYVSTGEWKARDKKSSQVDDVSDLYANGTATGQYTVKDTDSGTELVMETIEYGDDSSACLFFDENGTLVAQGTYTTSAATITRTAKVTDADAEKLEEYVNAATGTEE